MTISGKYLFLNHTQKAKVLVLMKPNCAFLKNIKGRKEHLPGRILISGQTDWNWIVPGLPLGIYTLAIIENGLNHLGASPYVYPFVRGGLIFIAMYADSLSSKVNSTVRSDA